MIKLINYFTKSNEFNNIGKSIYNILEYALYVNELSRLSLTIPGEKVSKNIGFAHIYSTCISSKKAFINVRNIAVQFDGIDS